MATLYNRIYVTLYCLFESQSASQCPLSLIFKGSCVLWVCVLVHLVQWLWGWDTDLHCKCASFSCVVFAPLHNTHLCTGARTRRETYTHKAHTHPSGEQFADTESRERGESERSQGHIAHASAWYCLWGFAFRVFSASRLHGTWVCACVSVHVCVCLMLVYLTTGIVRNMCIARPQGTHLRTPCPCNQCSNQHTRSSEHILGERATERACLLHASACAPAKVFLVRGRGRQTLGT